MKNKGFKIKYLNKNKGSALIGVLITLVILSIFGLALLNVSKTGFKNSVVEREYDAVYYIAESGINHAELIIENIVLDITESDNFYQEFESLLYSEINGIKITEFAPHFRTSPEANLSIISVVIDEGTGDTPKSIQCEIESEGVIDQRKRTVTASFKISLSSSLPIASFHPAFNYTIYTSGNKTLKFPKGTTIIGDIYSKNVNSSSSNITITGDFYPKPSEDPMESIPELTKGISWGGKDLEYESKSKEHEILPGSYGKLELKEKVTAKFSHGDYYFKEFECDEKSTIILDFSEGPINIYVLEDAEFKEKLKFKVLDGIDITSPIDVKDLYRDNPQKAKELAGMFYTQVHKDFKFESGTWFGTALVGKKAEFKMESDTLLIGSFSVIGEEFKIESEDNAKLKIVYAPPTKSAAATGTGGVPGGEAGSGNEKPIIGVSVVKPVREK